MQKNIIRIIVIVALFLSVPLIAMQFTHEVNWDLTDFVVMGVLLFSVGLGIDLAVRKMGKYKAVAIVAIVLLFLYVWAELAVGIFNIPGISGS